MKKLLVTLCLVILTVSLCACKNKPDIEVINDNGLYIINLPPQIVLEPFVSNKVKTNKTIFEENNFLLSMNAGYFDTVNKQTTSFVTIDKKIVLDPNDNTNLTQNPKLKSNIPQILNRSELRYLACSDGNKYTIQHHNDLPPTGCEIQHAIQGGPQILPKLTLEDEYFVSPNRDSISSTRKVARIAVGIHADNSLSIIVATKSHPMSLPDMQDYISTLGIKEAINFDGGGSVSLNYKDLDIFSDYKNTRRQVKSFLVVKKY